MNRVFHTKYDVAEKKVRILDSRDNVDRLSYVDSSLMIKRFIAEGQNLALHRAKALASGLYGLDDLKEDERFPAVPLYEQDPAISQKMTEDLIGLQKSEFEERAKQSEGNSDLDKEVKKTDSVVDAGPASV